MTSASVRAGVTRVPILMFHALDDVRSPIAVSRPAFEAQMRALSDQGYQGVTLGALLGYLRHDGPPAERPVVITFDDGFESVYSKAWPVLQDIGFEATVFLVADYCGRTNDWPSQPANTPRLPLMDWRQAREMDRSGMEFGGHTLSHPRLDRVPADDLIKEIVDSKARIEDELGHAIDTFAYPYGRYSAAAESLVRENYSGACGTRLALAGADSDPLMLERVDAYYLQSAAMMRRLSTPAMSAYLAVRRSGRTLASALLRRPW